jgi:hypothetical protein
VTRKNRLSLARIARRRAFRTLRFYYERNETPSAGHRDGDIRPK